MEIERKIFDGSAFPAELPLQEEAVVYQGYLAVHPGGAHRSKCRDGKTGYVLCFKGEGTIARQGDRAGDRRAGVS